jgi:hypothetical protein
VRSHHTSIATVAIGGTTGLGHFATSERGDYARRPVKTVDEYNEMKDALRLSDGALLASDLLALKRSLRVFVANCDELLGHLGITDDQLAAIHLWAIRNREDFDRFLDEVERLHHNVVAAAMTLRQHSYRVRDKWLPPDERGRDEYEAGARRAFAESRAAELLQGLRVIVQKRKLPELRGHASHVQGGPFESSVRVDLDDLSEWDGWTAATRASLEAGDDVILEEIVAEYRGAVVEFHGWFRAAVRQRNAAALDDFERGRKQLADYATGMFGGPPTTETSWDVNPPAASEDL